MNLESQVTSFKLSKRLKELNCKKESFFYWSIDYKPPKLVCPEFDEAFPVPIDNHKISAFTVAELGEILPHFVFDSQTRIYKSFFLKRNYCEWFVGYGDQTYIPEGVDDPLPEARTEANVRAMMLIYLIEKEIIKP